MKREKKIVLFLSMLTLIISLCRIESSAAGPLDGQVVDDSLLVSETEAFDEKPLVLENPFEQEITPYGTYLSFGSAHITNKGSGMIYMSGDTTCHRTSDSVQVNLYLDKLVNGSWSTIKIQHHTEYNTYFASNGLYMAVAKGYYYRVRGAHIAKKGSKTESTTTCTNGIYIG